MNASKSLGMSMSVFHLGLSRNIFLKMLVFGLLYLVLLFIMLSFHVDAAPHLAGQGDLFSQMALDSDGYYSLLENNFSNHSNISTSSISVREIREVSDAAGGASVDSPSRPIIVTEGALIVCYVVLGVALCSLCTLCGVGYFYIRPLDICMKTS